jgi:L-aspartate oxidase
MALRAGVAVADLEFVQFHPTALHHPSMPRPLLSEALRGHGALLRDARGRRFVDELLPRDRVSQAIMAKVSEQGTDHVWLDATRLERFGERFPTIAASLAAAGLDPSTDWLPVAPAAHYTCGGIVADLDGASSLPGLWVAGEAACNGVHGANRLASNSLLDGMVFGPRVVEAVERGKDGPEATGAMRCVLDGPHGDGPAASGRGVAGRRLVPPRPARLAERATSPPVDEVTKARASLQRAMTAGAGVLRSAASLARAGDAAELAFVGATRPTAAAAVTGPATPAPGPDVVELRNLATVGRALCACALARTETRGAHARSDHPDLDPAQRVRYVVGGPGAPMAQPEG